MEFCPKIEISVDDYKQKLTSHISGLVLKNNTHDNCIKESLESSKIKYSLENIQYPFVESFIMVLESGNLQKMHQQMNKIERWLYFNTKDDSIFRMIESFVCSYQANLNRKKLDPHDVDSIVESLVLKTRDVLREMVSNIEIELSYIGWNNHPIHLKALYVDDKVANTASVSIGENYSCLFDYKKTDNGFLVENVVFSEMPESMRTQIDALLQRIKDSPKIKKMVTLYMAKPHQDRNLFERKRRDISLGIKTTLPKNTILMNMPIDEKNDIWKVRIKEEKLSKILNEGDFLQYQLMDESDLIWINLVEAKNEK